MTNAKPIYLRNGVIACLVVIVVGSLYPFVGWRPLATWSDAFLSAPLPRFITRNDVGTNLVAYLPLGYLLTLYLIRPGRRALPILATCLSGALLSLAMESLQVLLPGRIASNLDIMLNGLGTLTGALLALHHSRWLRAGRALYDWRHTWFRPHGAATPGLWLLLAWLLAQFALVPLPGVGWSGIHLVAPAQKPADAQLIDAPWFFTMFMELVALGTFTACLLKPGRYVGASFLVLALAFGLKLLAWALLMKPKVIGGLLSPETLAAFVLALWVLLLPSVSRHRRAVAAGLLSAIVVGRVLFVPSPLWPSGSLLNLVGLARHLAALWPWLALAYLIKEQVVPRTPR